VAEPSPVLPLKRYQVILVLVVAAIGFLFDTYELLMLPLIGGPAIAELLGVPVSNPVVRETLGYILWAAALSGGIAGLLGGVLIDRFGRKTVMVGSILVYSLSPVAAAFSTNIYMFTLFRCGTFIGVCVEFVAAITWLAELFQDKRARELAIGWTQAFASVGGLVVTAANVLTQKYADQLPAIPVPEPFDAHASWRYTLTTGLIPGILILLFLPFVPESRVWQQRKRAGTLGRPKFRELFAPELRRTTIVATLLSACAYAAAFGALQLTPTQIVPGLPSLKEQQEILKPLQAKAAELNKELDEQQKKLKEILPTVNGLEAIVLERDAVRREIRKINEKKDRLKASGDESGLAELDERLKANQAKLSPKGGELTKRLQEITAANKEAYNVVIERERILRALVENRAQQKEADDIVRSKGNTAQFWQEMGGLAGRIVLALLIVVIASKGLLLRLFQFPGLIAFPLTYYYLFQQQPDLFVFGVFLCGMMTVAQFSYFGEYLPKAYPIHLRGTGGSFATNVGGRMIGTSASFLTTSIVAPLMGKSFETTALAAAIVGGSVYAMGLVLSFFLPQPKGESH
jgi:MFS family permease